MDNLETLNALLEMTREAEELASDVEKSERLRSLVVETCLYFRCRPHNDVQTHLEST
jgi:hypothetical protein